MVFFTLSTSVSFTVTTPVWGSIWNGTGGPVVSKPKITGSPPVLSRYTLVTKVPIGSEDVTYQFLSTWVSVGRLKPGGACDDAETRKRNL